jgi:hypothetical protein
MAWPSRWPDAITTDELVTAAWLSDVSNSFTHLERVAFGSQTTTVTINTTTAATSVLLVSAGTFTAEAIPYRIVMDAPCVQRIQTATTSPSVFLGLYDNGAGTPIRSKLGQIQVSSADVGSAPFHREYIWTPSSGSRTPELRGYANTADDWDAHASGSDGDNSGPITIAVYREVPA